MKKILILMVLIISIIGIGNAQTGATDLDQGLQVSGGYMAKDRYDHRHKLFRHTDTELKGCRNRK